jgi:CBS domain-containing protein
VKRTLVAQVMTTPVVTATEAMPFRHLVALLHARDIGAVPVLAPDGRVLGLVSRPDLIPKVAGTAPAGPRLVTVSDGIVSVSGRVECRSAIPRLVSGIQEVEGVIGVDQSIAYDIDDRYPITSASF